MQFFSRNSVLPSPLCTGQQKMLLLQQTLVVVLLLASFQGHTIFVEGQFSAPSEFLYSYLSKAKLLPNSSVEPTLVNDDDVSTISVFVDNWSEYALVYSTHSISQGLMESKYSPRNLPQKSRSFALRSFSKNRKRSRDEIKGMAGWTLVGAKNGVKISRVSVAWDIQGKSSKFAMSLGDIIPDVTEMFKNDLEAGGRLASRTSFELDKLVKVADTRTTVAAKLTKDENKNYKLLVTIIPQNIDVYGWVKYFQEQNSVSSSQPEEKKSFNNKRSQEIPLPKITKQTDSVGTQISMERTSNSEDVDEQKRPLFHKKELLRPGRSLLKMEEKGLASLRDSLRVDAVNFTVAVGIQVENWSRFKLVNPTLEMKSGEVLRQMPPADIDPGRQEVCIIGNGGGLSGTNGVLRWNIGSSTGKSFSVMWSVPFNMQFWSSWVAVGLTPSTDPPTYNEMYSREDESRFLRMKSGREFEFSDGQFLVITYMDGGANSKPVLHFGLVPFNDADLAASVRTKLKLPLLKSDDMGLPFVAEQSSSLTNSAQSLSSCLCPCGTPQSISRWGYSALILVSLFFNFLNKC